MAPTTSTKILEEEHRTIQKAVAGMSLAAGRLETGQALDGAILRDTVAFLRDFMMARHYAKEERFLFPLLEARGVPASGYPLAVLRYEHQKGRALSTQLGDATEAFLANRTGKEALVSTLRDLVRLYVDHLWKEDYLLLPMANKVLSDDDQAELCEQFDSLETELGPEKSDELRELAARLSGILQAESPVKGEDTFAGAPQRVPGPTGDPHVSFELSSELHRLRTEEHAWEAGRNAKILVKYPDFRILLIGLRPGAHIAEHKASGSISMQVSAGHILVRAAGQPFELREGQILSLEREVPHSLEALAESAVLVTIAWPGMKH